MEGMIKTSWKVNAASYVWRRISKGSDSAWVMEHEGTKYFIYAFSYRGGLSGDRFTGQEWSISAHLPGGKVVTLRKPGSANYSGFRTLSKQVEAHIEGISPLVVKTASDDPWKVNATD